MLSSTCSIGRFGLGDGCIGVFGPGSSAIVGRDLSGRVAWFVGGYSLPMFHAGVSSVVKTSQLCMDGQVHGKVLGVDV